MAETKVTGVRIPEPILTQLDRLVGVEGGSRSEVIIALLSRGLGMDAAGADTATVLDRIEALEKKLLSCLTSGKSLNSVEQNP